MYQANITAGLPNSQSIVTISFFRYKGLNVLWALKEMQSAKRPLSETPGLNFFKLMGSGGGEGFSLKPDFNVYALVGVWKNRNYAKNFLRTSKVFRGFKDHSKEWWTIFMVPLKSRGNWNKKNPFIPIPQETEYEGPIAVLTRATISPRHLFTFWNSVPGVSGILKEQDGLIFSKGLGEYPVFQQATFSIWENYRAVQLFAYHSEKHKDAIGKTKEIGWYKEDLFSEFKILGTEGRWEGIDFQLSQQQNGEPIPDLMNHV